MTLTLIGVVILFGFVSGLFAQSISITEGDLTLVAIVATLMRLVTIVSLGLLIATSVSREFQSQALDVVLASDITRAEFYLGKFFGYATNALLICCLLMICLLMMAPLFQALLWGMSLFFEALIVIAFALFCSFSFSQQTITLCLILGFYVLSRSISAITLIAETPAIRDDSLFQTLVPYLIDALATLLPDFSRFTQTQWLVYESGAVSELSLLFIQTFIYTSLLIFAGLVDFYRKNF